ncbi:MAG: c-type cytochrome [Bacteroidia bacterium]|nr:c-type cytochrome [Bacteroidia bacterium]
MKNRIALMIIASIASVSLFAQGAEPAQEGGLSQPLLWIIYAVVALLLLVTYLLYQVTISLKKYVKGEYQNEEQKMYDQRSTWEKIFQVKPVGTDKDTIINEAHDGIYELANPPPPWFMFLFYGTILFAVIYFVRYSVTGTGLTQEEEYIAEMAIVEEDKTSSLTEEGASVDENTVVALTSAEDIASGKKIYIQNCKVCHADGGAGSVGPNLTDEFWKHGGGAKNIFKTIKYGVVEKGMTAWQDNLTPKMMQEVTSYILSLEGTNPPDAKEAEGDKWVPEAASDEAPTETEVTETEEVEG